MNKLIFIVTSLIVAGCQTQFFSQQSSFSPQENKILQRYADKLVKLENSENYLVEDVVLYRVNGNRYTNLTFIYDSKDDHIKAVLMNCTTQESEEIGYYSVNEITEKILAGYLPPDDPQATPIKHEPPIPISIPALGYSLVCK